jgi:hypothetical protein
MLRDSRLLAMRLPFKCATRIGPGTFWVSAIRKLSKSGVEGSFCLASESESAVTRTEWIYEERIPQSLST